MAPGTRARLQSALNHSTWPLEKTTWQANDKGLARDCQQGSSKWHYRRARGQGNALQSLGSKEVFLNRREARKAVEKTKCAQEEGFAYS